MTAGEGRGWARGTCGELVQGVTSSGEHFQVSCPVDRWATVDVVLEPAPTTEVIGLDSALVKTQKAVELALETLGVGPARVRVTRHNPLPPGKGLGSSTADVLAAARAVAAAARRTLPPDRLARLAGAIEPSDGTMYPGIAAVRRRGEALRRWGWWPRFTLVAVLPPGTVDTTSVEFAGKERLAAEYDDILDRLDAAVAARDSRPFAAAATRSARLNQHFLDNPWFDRLEAMADELSALGVVVAHTGTIAGLLFWGNRAGMAAAARARSRLLAGLAPEVGTELYRTPPLEPCRSVAVG